MRPLTDAEPWRPRAARAAHYTGNGGTTHPTPPDIDDELWWSIVFRPPLMAHRMLTVAAILAQGSVDLTAFLRSLDAIAIRCGQDHDGATCAALLDLSDAIRDWEASHAQ